MNILLAAAERDGGNAMDGEPIGVETAISNRPQGLQIDGSHGAFGRQNARLMCVKPEGLVIKPAGQTDLARHARHIAHCPRGMLKGVLDRRENLAAESRIVAASFGLEKDVICDDIRRRAAVDDADIAGAMPVSLAYIAEPTVPFEFGDGQTRNRNRAHAMFGSAPGVA